VNGTRKREAEMLGRVGHGRDERRRVVRRHLHRLPDRGLGPAAIDVVHADHVGEKQRVETALLEQPSQIDPWLKTVELKLA